jgi:hypothetical protein
MAEAVSMAATLVAPGGWLALMTTTTELDALQVAAGETFAWADSHPSLGGESRVLALGQNEINLPA